MSARKKTARRSHKPRRHPRVIVRPGAPFSQAQVDDAQSALELQDEQDRGVLKVTGWNQGRPWDSPKTLGDWIMALATGQDSFSGTELPFCVGNSLRSIAQEIGVLADAELLKRGERSQDPRGIHAVQDLYGPLRSLQRRLEAMGELVPRVFRANAIDGKVPS